MKLTDQEQVILKAIERVGRNGLALISEVVRAVGYPKATTKKALISLSNKGAVSLHRHDWPSSLKPEQRKLLVRIGRDYFSAVSMRKRNPAKKSRGKAALTTAGKAVKGFAQGTLSAASQLLGAGATALNPKKFITLFSKLNNGDKFKIHQASGGFSQKARGKVLTKKSADIAEGSTGEYFQIYGLVNVELIERRNPSKRIRVKNKYIDLVIKGQAKKTPQGWQVGKKTFAQGRGTVNVSSGYYLDRHTGTVYAKRERNKSRRKNVEQGFYDASGFHPIRASSDYSEGQRPSRSKKVKAAKSKATATRRHKLKVSSRKRSTKSLASRSLRRTTSTGKKLKRKRNVAMGHYDASGTFHPWRSSPDYDPGIAGETGRKPKRTRSKKKLAAKRKASATARRRSGVRARKATTRIASRGLSKRTSTGKRLKRARKNPSAESIRKKFAGRVTGERDVFVPSSTPKGKLAKLGNLVLIQTEQGTIKPVRGTAVLLADTRGKLHIGTTGKTDLFSGPRQSFGHVKRIEYDSSKPHLGYPSPIIWHHKMGEEGGKRPTLYADGQGGLVFRGGSYRLTRRGIEN
jgi:hypothetical protein